jgi:hypothetical protein
MPSFGSSLKLCVLCVWRASSASLVLHVMSVCLVCVCAQPFTLKQLGNSAVSEGILVSAWTEDQTHRAAYGEAPDVDGTLDHSPLPPLSCRSQEDIPR